jgi:hypothetical protein
MDTSGSFLGLLCDLAGRARMDSEDPRWGALFLAASVHSTVGHSAETGAELLQTTSLLTRLVANCRISNNLHVLLEQAGSRLDHMLSLQHVPTGSLSAQCTGALHLTSTVMAHLLANHAPEEV